MTDMKVFWFRHPGLYLLAVILLALVAVVSSQLDVGGPSKVVYQRF
jgi:hypothetical protein